MNEQIVVAFGADNSGLARGFREAKSLGADFKKSVGSGMGDMLKGGIAALGVGLTVEKLTETAKAAMELGHTIEKTSENLGVSTTFFQQFGYAARKSGSDSETAATGLRKLSVTIGEARSGSEEAEKKFAKWGITLSDTNGKALNTQQVMGQIAKKVASIEDPAQRSAIAFELLGKSGAQLATTLKNLEALKGASAGKILNETEIGILAEGKKNLEAHEGFIKIWSARVTAIFLKAFTFNKGDLAVLDKHMEGAGGGGDAMQSEADIKKAKEYAEALKEVQKAKHDAYMASFTTDQQKEFILGGQLRDLKREWNALADGSVEKLKKEKELMEAQKAYSEVKNRIDKKADEDKTKALRDHKEMMEKMREMQVRINDHQKSYNESVKKATESFDDRSKVSLEQLAEGRGGRAGMMYAAEINRLHEYAINARLLGNVPEAEKATRSELELRKRLGPFLKSDESEPLKDVVKAVSDSKDKFQELIDLATGEGFMITTGNNDAG